MELDYDSKKGTITQYRKQWKREYNFGHIPSVPKNLPHCRKWVWNKVVFTDKWKSMALSNEWVQSKNRNRMLVFNGELGSVQWFESGTVLVLLSGSSDLAMAKTLFCRAFHWLDNLDLSRLCDGSIREENRHWVFDVGVDLPRFKLDSFKTTHGLTIRSDGSHPGKLEVEETVPLYFQGMIELQNRIEANQNNFAESQSLFSENIRSHLELIEAYKKEAEVRADVHSKKHLKAKEGLLRKFLRVMVTPL